MGNLLLFVNNFYIVYFLQQQINNNIPNIIIYLHTNNTSLSLCEFGQHVMFYIMQTSLELVHKLKYTVMTMAKYGSLFPF